MMFHLGGFDLYDELPYLPEDAVPHTESEDNYKANFEQYRIFYRTIYCSLQLMLFTVQTDEFKDNLLIREHWLSYEELKEKLRTWIRELQNNHIFTIYPDPFMTIDFRSPRSYIELTRKTVRDNIKSVITFKRRIDAEISTYCFGAETPYFHLSINEPILLPVKHAIPTIGKLHKRFSQVFVCFDDYDGIDDVKADIKRLRQKGYKFVKAHDYEYEMRKYGKKRRNYRKRKQ